MNKTISQLLCIAIATLPSVGCSSTPYGTYGAGMSGSPAYWSRTIAERRSRLYHLEVGMSEAEVKLILLEPDKVEMGGDRTKYWLYITSYPTYVSHVMRELHDRYYTPLVFKNGQLIGWGRKFLRQGSESRR